MIRTVPTLYSIVFTLIFTQSTWAEAPSCLMETKKSQVPSRRVDDSALLNQWDLNTNLGPEEIYAYKLYARLTGTGISLENPRFKRIVKLIRGKDFKQAAQIITAEEKFLEVRVRNFAAPFSSKDFSSTEPFNDLQALIVGVVRDELDARLILTGDFRYSAKPGLGLPAVSTSENDHYLKFEEGRYNYDTDLIQVSPQWENKDTAAGAFTSRAWAKVNFDAGTNRRSVKNAIEVFLCTPIDTWKTRAVPDMFVRRDVDRAPGGNPATYQNNCRSCHSIMDGLAGSFAKADFVNGAVTLNNDTITAKMNQNGNVYPEGYVTTDDSWTNLLIYNSAIDFGWRSEMTGQGIVTFAKMLAESKAYIKCLVQKVFTEVCGAGINDVNPELLPQLVENFENDKRNLKNLFSEIAISSACLTHPGGG